MSFYAMVPLGLYFGIVQYKGYIKADGGYSGRSTSIVQTHRWFIQIDESMFKWSFGHKPKELIHLKFVINLCFWKLWSLQSCVNIPQPKSTFVSLFKFKMDFSIILLGP